MKEKKNLFEKGGKAVIALLHLRALPGDPFYDYETCSVDQVLETARADLHALQDGGVDAVLFSNEYSLPYQSKVDPVTIGAMGYIIGALKDEISVPYGVHVISDPMATIELAASVEADFTRSVFSGAYAGELGIRSLDIAAILRRRKALHAENIQMFYMIGSESDGDLSARKQTDIARAVIFKCHPDGLCVSGKSAGLEADTEEVREIREAADPVPVLFNTGVNVQNVQEKLASSDGAFVGTAFKYDGKFENTVDPVRVKEFMDKVNSIRG